VAAPASGRDDEARTVTFLAGLQDVLAAGEAGADKARVLRSVAASAPRSPVASATRSGCRARSRRQDERERRFCPTARTSCALPILERPSMPSRAISASPPPRFATVLPIGPNG
jgi:hypothetical protein